jgi:hypothetical protein
MNSTGHQGADGGDNAAAFANDNPDAIALPPFDRSNNQLRLTVSMNALADCDIIRTAPPHARAGGSPQGPSRPSTPLMQAGVDDAHEGGPNLERFIRRGSKPQ